MSARVESGTCGVVTVERRATSVIKATVPMPELPLAQRAARTKLAAALPALDLGGVGPGCTLWRPPSDGKLYMEMGVVVGRDFKAQDEIVPSVLPAGRAAKYLLVGSYDQLPGAWEKLFAWCAQEKLTPAGTNWEIYESGSPDPATPITALHVLLA